MGGARAGVAAGALAVALAALPAGAQTGAAQTGAAETGGTPAPQAQAPAPVQAPAQALRQSVLTVDQEALYAGSAWGRRAQDRIAAMTAQVSADNDAAFALLSSEEEALTAARTTLSADDFRARAGAFDERVTQVRREREAAARAIGVTAEADRQRFFQAAAPILGMVMRDRGALLVLDQRTVLFSDASIDVTAEVIARLDAELGDGAAAEAGPPPDAPADPQPVPGAPAAPDAAD